MLAGCGTAPRTPYTAADEAVAAIPHMADVRVFADAPAAEFMKGVCPNLGLAVGGSPGPAYLAIWAAAQTARMGQAC